MATPAGVFLMVSSTEAGSRTRATRRLWLAATPLRSGASRSRPANRRLAAAGHGFRDRGARRIRCLRRSTSPNARDIQPRRSGRRLQRAAYSSSQSSHRQYSASTLRYTNERMAPSVALALAYLGINDDEPVTGKLQISSVRKARRLVVEDEPTLWRWGAAPFASRCTRAADHATYAPALTCAVGSHAPANLRGS